MQLLHVTTESAARSILREGLRPAIGPRAADSGESEPAVYFFNSPADLEAAAWNWLSEAFENVDEPLIVLVVAVPSDLVQINASAAWEATVTCSVPAMAIVRAYNIDTGEPFTDAA